MDNNISHEQNKVTLIDRNIFSKLDIPNKNVYNLNQKHYLNDSECSRTASTHKNSADSYNLNTEKEIPFSARTNTLNIQKLLSESEYRIPIYQRNYAWSIPEVTQLIQDIADYAKESENDNYYIGTLVVFPHRHEGYYETIDGKTAVVEVEIEVYNYNPIFI